MGKSGEFVGGEEVESRDGAETTPVVTVGRPGEAGEVVAEVFAIEEVIGAVGEGDIILGEALSG